MQKEYEASLDRSEINVLFFHVEDAAVAFDTEVLREQIFKKKKKFLLT